MLFRTAPILLTFGLVATMALLVLPAHLFGGPVGRCLQRDATTICLRYVEGTGLTTTVDLPAAARPAHPLR